MKERDIHFKRVTLENWLKMDPTIEAFVSIATRKPLSADQWAKDILSLSLGDHVPDEIFSMFEAARNIMVFGYFFYPLFTIAEGQLFRVADAAVTLKCKQLGAPQGVDNLYRRLDWLRSIGVLSESERARWDLLRELRNIYSHPEHHFDGPPGPVIGTFRSVGEAIDQLFGNTTNQVLVPTGR